MLNQTHLMILVLVLPTLVACFSFQESFSDSLRYFVRDPFSKLHIEHSLIKQLPQGGSGSRAVNTNLYRLAQNIKPTKYDLTVVPFLVEGNFTFYGKVIINITVIQNTSEIILDSKYLTIKSLSLTDSAKATIDCDVDFTYQTLTIKPMNATLVTGKSYEVTIEYTGLLKDDFYGFYRNSYKIGSQVKWLALTQFDPTYASLAFPCFDDPAFRAVFTIHVGRFEYQNTISNMRLKSTSGKLSEFEGRVIDTYEDSPHMPTCMVAFCVGELVSVTSDDGKLRVSLRENAVDQEKLVMEIGESVLKTIADFVSVPYTLPKMDVIAVPDLHARAMENLLTLPYRFFGAMGNWGMTTYRENYVLYKDGVSSAMDKLSVVAVVAYEFGHQWFGNLVTSQEAMYYTWLNEGFATYFQYYVPSVMEPEWDMMSLFAVSNVQYGLLIDAAVRIPMATDVNTPAENSELYSLVTYQKGGSVLRMVEHFLSTSVFKTGLNYYLTNSSTTGIGTPYQLFSALDAAAKEKNVLPSGITVADVLNGWTTQEGFPLLTVNRTGSIISLSQKMFTTTAEMPTSTFWYIPLSYTTQSEGNFQRTSAREWLLPGINKSISTSDSGWIIFNLQQTGFYRVNYDPNNWELLAKQLQQDFDKIHVNNRAQLLDDAFNLADAGHVNYSVAFNMTRYLSQEREYVPWASAMTNLKYIYMLLQATDTGLILKEYVVGLVRPYYEYLMEIEGPSEPPQAALSRIVFVQWACDLGISECETYAGRAFNAWLDSGRQIGENVKAGVLCTGLKLGGDKEWDVVWNMYLQSNNYAEKLTILKALACTPSENSIDKYLNAVISPASDIRIQDEATVYLAIVSRQTGISPTIRFIVNNYMAMADKLGLEMFLTVLIYLGSNLVQDKHIQQVTAVVNDDTVSIDLRMSLNVSLNVAASNRQWVADHKDQIQLWLNETRASVGTHVNPTIANTLLCLTILFFAYFKC